MNRITSSSKSLEEVHSSIDATRKTGFLKSLFAFAGPAYLVSVGYMDPGNWATDIAAGSGFGYSLIWVLLMSNLIAILLQSFCARLGIVQGLDLAQASKASFPNFINYPLWVLAEIAIAACDLAEVLGFAIGLQLLFHLPLLTGVVIAVFDSVLLLLLIQLGMRKMEAFILALVLIICSCFFFEIFVAQPNLAEVGKGFLPSIPNDVALYIAIGIIGATVMPHNLYLHSALVQTRKIENSTEGKKRAIRFNIFDSAIALNLAFFVNGSILVLAGTVFFSNGFFNITEIQDAHDLLAPLTGATLAPILFAVALIASGQCSTITGTLAGQIIMEGYLNLRITPWLRRLITRLIAVIPAFLVIWLKGEDQTGDLLILSQVILSLQLGFAVIPLIHFVSDRKKMKSFTIGTMAKTGAWISTAIIVTLNVKLVINFVSDLIAGAGDYRWLVLLIAVPVLLAASFLFLYILFFPLFKSKLFGIRVPHKALSVLSFEATENFKRIAVAVDFSEKDQIAISHAISTGGKNSVYCLLHVVESAGAMMMENEISDLESHEDSKQLSEYAVQLRQQGYNLETKLGFGKPSKSLPKLVKAFNADLLVMGSHGHRALKDMIFGETIDAVRHRVSIPVLAV